MKQTESVFHRDRKITIQNRIVAEVSRFFGEYGTGMAMQTLSAKYGRALYEFGGFPETIAELESAGRIVVLISRNGARSVKPGVPVTRAQKSEPAYWF